MKQNKSLFLAASILGLLSVPLSAISYDQLHLGRGDSFHLLEVKTSKQPLRYTKSKKIYCSNEEQECITRSFVSLGKQFLDCYLECNFDIAMIGRDKEISKYKNFLSRTGDKAFLTVIKDQYHSFVEHIEALYSQTPRIPKIIHQIWVGPHPFPKEAREWQETWLRLHPDWEYKLWTNADVDQLDFANKTYYDEATNWGEKADILRYEIIYQFGGLYADIDQSCVKPFDVLHHACDFYAGVHALPLLVVHNNKLRIANGVLAATPGHPILKHVVEQIKNNRGHHNLLDRTGPDFFTKMIIQTLDHSRLQANIDVILPANYFYPYGERPDNQFKIKPGATIYIKPETLGVQYYTSYWLTPPKK